MKYLLFILLVIFATSLDKYLYNSGIFPLKPSYFFVPLFLFASILNYKFEMYLRIIKTHTFKFFLFFFFLSVVFSINTESTSEVIVTDIVNKIITLLLYTMAMCFFYKYDKKFIKTFFIVSVIVLGLSIWYDVFFGLNHIIINIRKGGFAANPNIGASALKFLGFCLILGIKNSKVRMILLLFLASTLFVTFSRSGLLSLIIMVALLIVNEWSPKFNIQPWKLISPLFKIIAVLAISYIILFNIADFIQEQIPAFSEGTAAKRIDFLLGRSNSNDILFLDQDESGRETVAIRFIELFKENPFGYGSGYAGDDQIYVTSPHNYFLTAAVDFGIIGLLILIWFLFTGFKSAIKFNYYHYLIFVILLFFECFISHDLFTERAILIALAFMDYELNLNKEEAD